MTHKEYMNSTSGLNVSREEAHRIHRTYHAQYVGPFQKRIVTQFIGVEKIKASTDPHFNDIPLAHWDGLAHALNIDTKLMKENGDFLTLGNAVCIAKEAATQIKEMITQEVM